MPETAWTIIGRVSDFVGIVGGILVAFTLWQLIWQGIERKRLNQIVSVMVKCHESQQVIKPDIRLRRKYTTRAEVQGVLGTIKMKKKGERYELKYLNSEKFGDAIAELMDPKNKGVKHNTLVIPCQPEEIEQFDSGVVDTIEEWSLFPGVIDKAR